MIKNEHQWRISKGKVKNLQTALKNSANSETKLHPAIKKAMLEGIKSQIKELKDEINEYETLKNSHKKLELTINQLSELPIVLIKARINRGLTQKELAVKLNLKAQQIQRYESSNYKSVSFERLVEVVEVLDLKIKQQIIVGGPKKSEKRILCLEK